MIIIILAFPAFMFVSYFYVRFDSSAHTQKHSPVTLVQPECPQTPPAYVGFFSLKFRIRRISFRITFASWGTPVPKPQHFHFVLLYIFTFVSLFIRSFESLRCALCFFLAFSESCRKKYAYRTVIASTRQSAPGRCQPPCSLYHPKTPGFTRPIGGSSRGSRFSTKRRLYR